MYLTNRDMRVIHIYNRKSVKKVYYDRPETIPVESENGIIGQDNKRYRMYRSCTIVVDSRHRFIVINNNDMKCIFQ